MRLRTAALLAVLAAHGGPAATWLPGLRQVCFPGLAGLGRPDHVALTFDDGPDPHSTPWFLEGLGACAVKATFFVLGQSVRRYPGLAGRIAEHGHELAVHGWTHDRPWAPGPLRDIRDLARAAEVVCITAHGPQTGRGPRRMAPRGRRLTTAAGRGRRSGSGAGPRHGNGRTVRGGGRAAAAGAAVRTVPAGGGRRTGDRRCRPC